MVYPEKSAQLFAQYPDLVRTDLAPTPLTERGIECRSGWFGIIDRLFAALAMAQKPAGFRIAQVKEKNGGLTVYTDSPGHSFWRTLLRFPGYSKSHQLIIHLLVRNAELESRATCEMCGLPGTRKSEKGSWRVRCGGMACNAPR